MGEKGDEKQLLGFLNAVLASDTERSGKEPIKSVEILENKALTADIINGKSCIHLREDAKPSLVLTDALEIHFVNMVKYAKQTRPNR